MTILYLLIKGDHCSHSIILKLIRLPWHIYFTIRNMFWMRELNKPAYIILVHAQQNHFCSYLKHKNHTMITYTLNQLDFVAYQFDRRVPGASQYQVFFSCLTPVHWIDLYKTWQKLESLETLAASFNPTLFWYLHVTGQGHQKVNVKVY